MHMKNSELETVFWLWNGHFYIITPEKEKKGEKSKKEIEKMGKREKSARKSEKKRFGQTFNEAKHLFEFCIFPFNMRAYFLDFYNLNSLICVGAFASVFFFLRSYNSLSFYWRLSGACSFGYYVSVCFFFWFLLDFCAAEEVNKSNGLCVACASVTVNNVLSGLCNIDPRYMHVECISLGNS